MNDIRLNTRLLTSLSSVLYMPPAEIMGAARIANSTWYHLMERPEGISVQQLLALANSLHIPVRRFFSSGKTDIIGRRDDYITDPYTPCLYDEKVLGDLVATRTAATWKRAAEVTGMSRSRLRDSLLAVTRTPVVRFLAVCEAFSIDPFEILVDPNPEAGRKKRTQATADVAREMADLKSQVSRLADAVEEMADKYKVLLERHNRLERAVVGQPGPEGIMASEPEAERTDARD